jgi:cation diffusion facilitator CzcD-associated flavoprotein CzcO
MLTFHFCSFPSSCCDVLSHPYSYSFEQNPDWSRVYPSQEEILNYLISVTNTYELYKYVRFNTTVERAEWDNDEVKWKI